MLFDSRNKKPFVIIHPGTDPNHIEKCQQVEKLLSGKFNYYTVFTTDELIKLSRAGIIYRSTQFAQESSPDAILSMRMFNDKPKILITDSFDMMSAANDRQIPIISFGTEFARVANQGFFATSPEVALQEIQRANATRLMQRQGICLPNEKVQIPYPLAR